MEQLHQHMTAAFGEEAFLRKLARPQADALRLFDRLDWPSLLAPLLPIRERISCVRALEALGPALALLAPEPEEPLRRDRRARWCGTRRP